MTKKALLLRSEIPDVEQLQNEELYARILVLDFNDMIPFVLSNIRKRGLMSWLFISVNVIGLVSVGTLSIWGFITGWISWSGFIIQLILGIFAGSVLIIPFHELLHGLAYRILGTKKIKYGANLQQFFFFVSADRFPVNKIELSFLALLPFCGLNLALLMFAIFFFQQYSILIGFLLLMHNLMCIGDFAISNFVWNEKGKVYSYDELENKKSYFYRSLNN